jgi:hypothetical protein
MVDGTPILDIAFQVFDFVTAGVLSPCLLKSPAARFSDLERCTKRLRLNAQKKMRLGYREMIPSNWPSRLSWG